MTKLNALPVTNHPLFGEYWDRYANAFNALTEKLEVAGIDVSDLREVIYSVKDIERLSFAYTKGVNLSE